MDDLDYLLIMCDEFNSAQNSENLTFETIDDKEMAELIQCLEQEGVQTASPSGNNCPVSDQIIESEGKHICKVSIEVI